MFSNRIITDLNQYVPEEKKILANKATQIFGTVSAFTGFLGAFTASRLGRRTMTLSGFFCVAISHFIISYWIEQHDGHNVVIFMILFRLCIQTFVASIFMMYISETCSDIQYGFVTTCHYSNGAIFSVTVEFLMSWLNP